MKYSVDRKDDEHAVLVDDEGKMKFVSAQDLPGGTHEGDIVETKEDSNQFAFLPAETEERRQQSGDVISRILARGKRQEKED